MVEYKSNPDLACVRADWKGNIDFLLISHDHHDHFNKESIEH